MQELKAVWMQGIMLHPKLANNYLHPILAFSLAARIPAFLCCFNKTIEGPGNTLYTGNDAASNTCQKFICIQYFHTGVLNICLHPFMLQYNNCTIWIQAMMHANYLAASSICVQSASMDNTINLIQRKRINIRFATNLV